ncbi:oligomeric golgi complex component, COG2-domain-containing protein [Dactylonectria estremocensis]|uniref:Conserved oligomeric Golgi complex subunit 2 n=1 Tax=Dactylonectria estremocensis TaxID=1079267 RepID=A0A9P9EWL0_9HYPO|nr:oligomeric golgi complex component, COG2-domain-containing protein [Dactylonectria estremocensis]
MATSAPDLIPPSGPVPAHSGASPAFNFGSSDSSEFDDDAPLPFPEALPRTDFLALDFQPAPYLSALPHRHQTLEDLRSDLRDRSAAISSELLELVNSNYTAFLSLGNELRGGDDKIEDVKVSLLGFRRAVEEVKTRVSTRKEETQTLSEELRGVRSAIEQGRKMIEVSERLSSLEERLTLGSLPASDAPRQWDEESDDEEDDDDNDGLLGSSPARLLVSAQECSRIVLLSDTIGHDTPIGAKTEERLTRCRNTLLLDLNNALKEAKKAGTKGQDRVLKYLAVYRVLGAEAEAVKALRAR